MPQPHDPHGAAPGDRPRPDFVLVDFDGTLAAADVGNRFFRRFTPDGARWDKVIADWMAERLTARQCLALECDLARAGRDEAFAFVDGFVLAPDAAAFVAAARSAGHHLLVASDGLTFYIERLLARAGLEVPFTANRLRFDGGALIPEFASAGPEVALSGGRVAHAAAGAAPGCGRCGNCKGAALRAARASGRYARLVAVGDGYSDRCAVGAADVVYAKGDLLAYCRAHGIAARPFAMLGEVARAEGWGPAAAPGSQPADPAPVCRAPSEPL
jgi:2-hydroxy-3-keto-5-methylthiopentenyl-1-phosphate phosphatase